MGVRASACHRRHDRLAPVPPSTDCTSWLSPDGKTLLVLSTRRGSLGIFAKRPGQPLRFLTYGASPSWSPDGKKIVFSDWDPPTTIKVMNADGTGEGVLTSGARNSWPAWSPDGTKIAFLSTRETGVEEIYTMRPNGSDIRRRTSTGGSYKYQPVWSPDGRRLVVVQDGELLLRADGTVVRNLTGAVPRVSYGTFSPDGASVVTDPSPDDPLVLLPTTRWRRR